MGTQYPVKCDCGRTHHVSAGEAGIRLACECRRTIAVPDLRTLRLSAGEPTASPELVIEALLRDGEVPGEGECVCCAMPTEEVSYVFVVCERPESKAGGWKINPLAFLFAHFFFVFRHFVFESTESIDRGRNIAYRLPIPMCRLCARGLSRSGIATALRKIDVYNQLLDKYPHASIGRLEY